MAGQLLTARNLAGFRRAAQPYRGLASIYDRVMGDAVFPTIRKTFKLALKKYQIEFTSVADLGCGTGRFLHYLAGYRVPVWGVDNSPDMLRQAAETGRGNGAKLLLQDITRLSLPKPVDLITSNFDTFNYLLSPRELSEAVARCYDNLADGGYLIFDCIAGSRNGGGWRREVQSIALPGVVSTWRIAWNSRARMSVVKMHYRFKDREGRSKRLQELHVQRWYPLPELARVLSQNRFAVRGFHDAETFLPATPDTFWIKCIAQK